MTARLFVDMGLHDVIVARSPYGTSWCAAITVDQRVTTFDCTHLHHSPAAAARCVGKMRHTLTRWAPAEVVDVHRFGNGYEVVELRLGASMRRFTWVDER